MNAVAAPVAEAHRLATMSEAQLWRRFEAHRDRASREALAQRYIPFARSMALRYRYATEPLDDLVQVANVGLLNAIDRFEPGRGSSFASFAAPTILGELKRHFRDRSWTVRIPRPTHDLLGRLPRATAKLTVELQRPPTPAEIAALLEVGVAAVLEALETAEKRRPLSLDHPLEEDEGEEQRDEWCGSEDPGYAHVEDRLALRAALPALDSRQREVLRLSFVEELPQSQIATRIGYSQMQVSRIIRGALQELRTSAAAA